MSEKYTGTVKWFSNRQGYGFISPTSENAPTKEDIFVHQSAIVTDGSFRTLKVGFTVSFSTDKDEEGKLRAQNVTSEDGSPCPAAPQRPRKRQGKKKPSGSSTDDEGKVDEQAEETGDAKEENAGGEAEGKGKKTKKKNNRRRKNGKKGDKEAGATSDEGEAKTDDEGKGDAKDEGEKPKKPKKEAKPSWFSKLDASVQESMTGRDIKVMAGRAFLSVGDSRIKLGTDGYAALARADCLLAEGKYEIEPSGEVKFTWERVLKLQDDAWASVAADSDSTLIPDLKLTDENVKPTETGATVDKLWGEEKPSPKEALEANSFMMRKIVLFDTGGRGPRGRGGRFRGRGGRGRGRGDKNGKSKEPAAAAE